MIVAGFGFRKGANAESLQNAYARARDTATADRFATLTHKANTPEFKHFARQQDAEVVLATRDDLGTQATITQSDASQGAYGTGSVAEAAALWAAGPGARLLGPRVVSEDRMATCALAIGDSSS